MPRALAYALLLAALPAAAQDGGVPAEVWMHRPLIAAIEAPGAELAPFVTDGCSGGMSEIWSATADGIPAFARMAGALPPWEDCCTAHDRAYHDAAGTRTAEASARARLTADRNLRTCVAATAPDADSQPVFDTLADTMFHAVRIGGAPCTGLSWRWGYGWPHCSPLGQTGGGAPDK